MKLENKSTRNYIAYDVILKAGEVLEVKDEKTAEILLKQPDVKKYIDEEEVEKLKKENQKLKEQNKKKKEEK